MGCYKRGKGPGLENRGRTEMGGSDVPNAAGNWELCLYKTYTIGQTIIETVFVIIFTNKNTFKKFSTISL